MMTALVALFAFVASASAMSYEQAELRAGPPAGFVPDRQDGL